MYRYDPTRFARANANVTSIAAEPKPPIRSPLITVEGTISAAVSVPATSDLGDDDLPARNRLRQQVDARPVLELHPERRRPEDEGDERQDDADDEAVDRRAERLRAELVLVGPDEEAEQHRHRGEQQHQQRPPPAEQRPERDRRRASRRSSSPRHQVGEDALERVVGRARSRTATPTRRGRPGRRSG